MTDDKTQRENDLRRQEFINHHASHSKRKGDWHFRQAELLGADGDYIPGYDDGEPRRGAYQD